MHVDGHMERVAHVDGRELLNELAREADDEHPDIEITLDSGWSLGILTGGRVFFENVEDPESEPCHLIDLSDNEVLALIDLIASADLDALSRLPWRDGYPTVG